MNRKEKIDRKNFFHKIYRNPIEQKISIKVRITLWYVFLMSGLIISFFSIIFYISNNLVKKDAYQDLKTTVSKSFSQITTNGSDLEIDNDLETLMGNIQISVFNNKQEFIYGYSPLKFEYDDTLNDNGEIRVIRHENKRWYMYEEKQHYLHYGDVWVRGVIESSVIENTLETIMFITLVALPIFLVFSGFTGYYISKNAFKPIEKIREAAQKINDGNDLTKRINLGNGKDEIYSLANTFDVMFDRLQVSFENEVQFSSDVSHELRTPISVIMTQSEFGENFVESADEAKKIFGVIFKESRKMSSLVSQLLLLARMDKGHYKLNPEEVNLAEIIEISVETMQRKAEAKNITIHTKLDENIYYHADEIMITRVMNNLISNAVSYGKENGFIKICLEKNLDETVLISVKDNGIGIAKENIDKIWTRFFQVEQSRTTENYGLGLSMVKWIVEAHHGNISVKSELGSGTSFLISLPPDNSF